MPAASRSSFFAFACLLFAAWVGFLVVLAAKTSQRPRERQAAATATSSPR